MDSQAVKDPSQFGFTWRIDRFSKMNAKNLYSDVFEVGGYKWRGLIFPKGNNVDYLSMYLDVANSASLPNGWSRYAEFSLTVVNQINNKDSVRKGTQHKFNKEQSDWGFTSFIPLGELFDTSKGYLVNDTLVVKVEVTISVDVKDTAEHLRERLKKEQEEEKHRNKEKPEAHLYTIIKVVLEEDLAKQIGKDIYFDLVDFDQVRSFRVEKKTPVNLFKEEVAKEFGIPAQFQCFWLWAKRQNHTCRPLRPLTDIENTLSVEQLRLNDKFSKKELKLFLVVERGLDLCPVAPLKKRNNDILLFFKLYDHEKEELRYVGSLFVNCIGMPSEILRRLNELAGYDRDEEIELYEEIKFEPYVMCEPVDKKRTYRESQLENGDIICFQKAAAMDNDKHIRYPDVPSYLEYVLSRRVLVSPSAKESKDEENKNIIAKEMKVDENTEAQQLKVDVETIHGEGTSKDNTSNFISKNLEEIDAMIDGDVIAAIDRVLSEGITISLQSQHSVKKQEVSKLDPNLPELLLQELRDIAFKEDLVEKFKKGLTPKVNFNTIKEKIDVNVDAFSSHQLEQVGVVVNLLNNIGRMFEKLENLKKDRDSAKKSTDQDNEALKETRQKILTSKTSFTDQQTQLNSLDAQIADLKAKRDKIADIQDQEKDKITFLNKEVKSIFHRLVDDQIKLKSVEDKIPEAQTELESHEKLYQTFRAVPPF